MAVVNNLEALFAKGTERAACPPGYNALLCWAGCPNAAERGIEALLATLVRLDI